jgi:hypothetical protein
LTLDSPFTFVSGIVVALAVVSIDFVLAGGLERLMDTYNGNGNQSHKPPKRRLILHSMRVVQQREAGAGAFLQN